MFRFIQEELKGGSYQLYTEIRIIFKNINTQKWYRQPHTYDKADWDYLYIKYIFKGFLFFNDISNIEGRWTSPW